MINFILPGMYEHCELNFRLLNLMKKHPEWFYENIQIGAVYGNFQFCIFDGGRIFSKYKHTCREEVENIVKTYNDYGVPVRLVFTNPEIQPKHFHNRFGQMILDVCHNGKNEIVVNNLEFENYLRTNYPNFGYISSTTKCLNTVDGCLNELDKDYKMVCLDYNLNKNWKMLNAIPKDNRYKCEFLINAICPPGCPNRKEHYRLNGLYSLSYGRRYTTQDCPIIYNTLHPGQCNNKNNLTPEEIYTKYASQGFINFKIEGRTLGKMENICNYVKYLVKPEYQLYVLEMLTDEDAGEKCLNNGNMFITPHIY